MQKLQARCMTSYFFLVAQISQQLLTQYIHAVGASRYAFSNSSESPGLPYREIIPNRQSLNQRLTFTDEEKARSRRVG